MSFNPFSNKSAQEVKFSHKISQTNHPILTLSDTQVEQTSCQKHLGMLLDYKLNFYEHIQNILSKVNRLSDDCRSRELNQDLQIGNPSRYHYTTTPLN